MVRIGVLPKYGLYLLLAGLVLAAVLLWWVINGNSAEKTPSRGVFVCSVIEEQCL